MDHNPFSEDLRPIPDHNLEWTGFSFRGGPGLDLLYVIVTTSKSCLSVLDSHFHIPNSLFKRLYRLIILDTFITINQQACPFHLIVQNRRRTFGLSSSGRLLSSSIRESSLFLSSGSVPPKEYTLEV
jgi:hypothetical protein